MNINTHRATRTHRYRTHTYTYRSTYTTAMHTYVHTAQQYARPLPDQQVRHTSVTPGGHSVRHTEVVPTLNTELTNHSYGGKHGSEPIPAVFHISKYNKKRCDCGDDRHSSNTFSHIDTNSKGLPKYHVTRETTKKGSRPTARPPCSQRVRRSTHSEPFSLYSESFTLAQHRHIGSTAVKQDLRHTVPNVAKGLAKHCGIPYTSIRRHQGVNRQSGAPRA